MNRQIWTVEKSSPVFDLEDYFRPVRGRASEMTRPYVAWYIVPPVSGQWAEECEGQDEMAQRFQKLAQAWENDTINLSSVDEIVGDAAYQELVAMGEQIIPLVFEKMEGEPSLWFLLLSDITGENPVPARDRGDVAAMARAWKRWGKRNGYR